MSGRQTVGDQRLKDSDVRGLDLELGLNIESAVATFNLVRGRGQR
jgi:hypothetical protein